MSLNECEKSVHSQLFYRRQMNLDNL